MLTEEDDSLGKIVNSIAYVYFFEVGEGGVIVVEDKVYIGKKLIGKVLGFMILICPIIKILFFMLLKRKQE
jgi:hypothetical protein